MALQLEHDFRHDVASLIRRCMSKNTLLYLWCLIPEEPVATYDNARHIKSMTGLSGKDTRQESAMLILSDDRDW